MSEPWGDPSCGISSGDVLIRPGRHPACRRREAQPGSCTERENLTGDGKGKGASGSNRGAESTDGPEGGGSPPVGWGNRQREEPDMQRKAAAFVRWHEPDDARVSSPDL